MAWMLALGAMGCHSTPPREAEWNETTVTQIKAWRAKHETDYRREWATIEGLHFLSPGTHTAGSAAANDVFLTSAVPPALGRFIVTTDHVSFVPQPGVPLTINGKTPEGET